MREWQRGRRRTSTPKSREPPKSLLQTRPPPAPPSHCTAEISSSDGRSARFMHAIGGASTRAGRSRGKSTAGGRGESAARAAGHTRDGAEFVLSDSAPLSITRSRQSKPRIFSAGFVLLALLGLFKSMKITSCSLSHSL